MKIRRPFALAAALALGGCGPKQEQTAQIQTVPVDRRDIIVDVEATGVVEPINVVEVKSKASGQITRMPVETGSQVRPGDLLVQLDTRDVRNQYNQALADLRAAEAKLEVSSAQKKRADELHGQRIITSQEHEAATIDYANAQASLVRARTSLDLAQQRLEDATVRAPVSGTIIEKLVSLGQVIASATGTLGGGTTLLKMADLNQVRVRALVTETDIGGVEPGQPATVIVDAYPERPFRGVVEKIEPQAVVQQSVTMFPVLITIRNQEGLLKPGMNGEVAVLIERRENVLAVPNDAVRNPREAMSAAAALGLDPESVRSMLQSQRSGPGNGGPQSFTPGSAVPTNGGAPPREGLASPGEILLASRSTERQAPPRQDRQPTAQQCAAVREAMAKNPAEAVDARIARSCMTRAVQGQELATPETPTTPRRRGRSALVFVAENGSFVPRMIMVGVSNYDYTEVLNGLAEGEQVVLLSAAVLQARQQEFQDRIRSRTSIPGLQRQGASSGGGGGGRPR